MEIIIEEKDKFAAHAELNQITGIVMAVIMERNKRTKGNKNSIKSLFPEFCKIVDAINKDMQQHAIT